MAVVVELRWFDEVTEATLNKGVWTCDDPEILERLVYVAAHWRSATYIRNKDLALAEHTVKTLGIFQGRILRADPFEPWEEGILDE